MTNYVLPPDNTSPIVLQSGDTLTVKTGATSHNITVLNGGKETVLSGGHADLTTINDGGVANVAGRADLTTINGGELDVASGGHVLRTTINAHGVENLSGEFVDTMVQKTGIENVLSGGVSKNAKVYGVETVAVGGVVDHALIYSGGVENVSGKDVGSHVYGQQNVLSGGVSDHTEIHGVENIAQGGKAIGDSLLETNAEINVRGVSDGLALWYGTENVYTGGISDGTDVRNEHGVLNVYSGGVSLNTKLQGTEYVAFGGLQENLAFGYFPTATLKLATPTGLKGAIHNWQVGDVIDLLNTTVKGVSQNGSHLTVTYGNNQTVTYSLVGQQANTHFAYHSDGHGGTDVVLVGLSNHGGAFHFV